MAYKFQHGEAILSGSLYQEGNVELASGKSLVIGSAAMSEADLEQIDGITAGTVAASKAVVVDANKDASGFRNITSTGAFIASTVSASSTLAVAAGSTFGGSLLPLSDGVYDLGSSAKEFKDLYIDGVAYVDSLQADQLGAALDANSQAITNINVDSGAIDGTVIGANSQAAAEFTTISGSGALSVGSNATVAGAVLPLSDGAYDLGSSAKEWKDLYVDGVAYVDSLQADQLGAALDANSQAITNINVDSGAIDGTTVGASSQSSGKFTTLSASSTLQAAGTVSGYGNADFGGSVTAGSSFIIGSADLNEADMEKLDGITNGTVAASKAVVVDADKDATGFRSITGSANAVFNKFFGDGGGLTNISSDTVDTTTDSTSATRYIPFVDQSTGADGESLLIHSAVAVNPSTGVFTIAGSAPEFVIGSAALNEADMEKLDGITNGTAAASKAVVLDANKDVTGLRDVSGRKATLSSLTSGRLVTAGTSGLLEDQDALQYDDDRSGYDGYLTLMVSSSASGSAHLQDGSIQILDKDENPQLWIYDSVAMIPAAGDAAMVVADSLYFYDATDGSMKRESVSDFSTLVAGDGLGVASSQLKLDLNELTAASINVANDSFALIDADDGNKSKKESIADLATAMAGSGIGAASGQFKLALDELSDNQVASGDFFAYHDVTDDSSKKDTVDDLASLFAGAGLAATSAVLAVVNATNGGIGVQANDIKLDLNDLAAGAVDVSADSIAIVDADDSSKSKKESIVDFVSAIAGGGLSAASGQLSVQGNSVALKANGDTLVEGYNYFANISGSDSSAVVDLPAAPSVGDVVHIKAGSLASGKTISAAIQGSHLIDGTLDKIILESSHSAATLVYVASNAWRLV